MNNKKNIYIILGLVAAVLAGLFLGNLLAGRANQQENISSFSSLFKSKGSKIDNFLSLIGKQYVDTVDVDSLTEDMMMDLVAKLDPHSVYIPAKDLEAVNDELDGSFSGIGVQFNIQNDTVMIVSVISGGPSEKAGLMAGDRIVKVNDSIFVGKNVISNEKVMRKLRGQEGTKVKLSIKRAGTNELLSYDIIRGKIPVNSVTSAYMITPDIGFIGVDKFAQTTYDEFLNAIAELRAKGAKKYIIDLRENSGGLMDQAINMVNEFLPENQMIVYAEGKAYPRFESKSNGKGALKNNPVVVLIDEFSASASEIFAGAIQDNDRGTIIGRRSFGKGLVQQQIPFSDGSAVRLTVARYYTPSGRSIQKPYINGQTEEYEKDLLERFKHGEFDSKDSIHQKETLRYKTLKGRTVYGGGGIMPDIFVPRDTSEYSPYLTKVINYGYLYKFAFQYTDKNRATLNTMKTWQQMDNYLSAQNLLSQFTAFATSKGIHPNTREINISKNIILNQIEAYIIRNILGDAGFYPMFNKDDKTVKKALETLGEK
ncbi:C-terminal processing peptidase-3 [uncultured Paludibacter sp.]|nr:C-terminal processing peptidase-3 [uncultured Paludibacter sp.]